MKKEFGILLIGITIMISAIIYIVPNARLLLYNNTIKSSTEFTVEGEISYMNGYICNKTSNQLIEDMLGSYDFYW